MTRTTEETKRMYNLKEFQDVPVRDVLESDTRLAVKRVKETEEVDTIDFLADILRDELGDYKAEDLVEEIYKGVIWG